MIKALNYLFCVCIAHAWYNRKTKMSKRK